MKNLIVDYIPFGNTRTDSTNPYPIMVVRLIVHGVLVSNPSNQNGRVYPREILERESW